MLMILGLREPLSGVTESLRRWKTAAPPMSCLLGSELGDFAILSFARGLRRGHGTGSTLPFADVAVRI